MILNYRVELCRECYYKRTQKCKKTDLYIQNLIPGRPGGECTKYRPLSWFPFLEN
jgi:hypothetical protein